MAHESLDASIAGKGSHSPFEKVSSFAQSSLQDVQTVFHNVKDDISHLGFQNVGFFGDKNDGSKSGDSQDPLKQPNYRFTFESIKFEHHEPKGVLDRIFGHDSGPSLHDKISDRVKEKMPPEQRTELEQQQKQYDEAMKRWALTMSINAKPPDLKDYPLVEQHAKKVQQAEQQIMQKVLGGLTPDEQKRLDHENNPLGDGFAPRPMNEEVAKRLRKATEEYLQKDGKQKPETLKV